MGVKSDFHIKNSVYLVNTVYLIIMFQAISVENAFMEEKEGAIIALKEMCINAGPSFAPYLQVRYSIASTSSA